MRLSTKYNGGTNLLKGLKHSNKLWEFLDNLLVTWIKLAKTKHLPIFLKHTSQHFQNNFQKTNENLFKRHTPLYTSQHGSLQRLPPHWLLFKTFSNPHIHKHHFKQLKTKGKWSKQVTKSPWITMDRKGANTFPFYNLLPEPKKTSQKVFCCAF